MKTRYCLRTYTIHFVFALAAIWPLQAVVANEDVTTLCNNGSTALYFASLAEQTGFNQTRAMIQGMTEVKPGTCEDIMPYGMHKVTLAFFKKDSRGMLTNTSIVPKNATQVNLDVQHICVNMSAPYRLFGNRQSIYSRYVNTACPQGFSPAKPAWGAPKGAAFVVLSVRVRYQHAQPLTEADWEQVRAQFKRTYPAARRRAANPNVVRGRFKIGGVSHTLELVAEDYRSGRLSRYSITII